MKAGDVVRFYTGSRTSARSRNLVHGTLIKVNALTVWVRLPGHRIIKRKIARDLDEDDRRCLLEGGGHVAAA